MNKVLSVSYIPPEVVSKFNGVLDIDSPTLEKWVYTPEEVQAKVGSVDAYMGPANKEMIDKISENVKIIGTASAGFDHIDHRYAGEKGISVTNAPQATTEVTAELAITLLLCVARRIPNYMKYMTKIGKCAPPSPYKPSIDNAAIPTTPYGKVLGIVGFGKIGKAVARKAQGLGMSVIYYDIYRASADVEKDMNVKYVEFDELLKTSDYVTLHCMYLPELHHMMNAEKFALMKKDAYFINAARGPLMDEKALIEALKNKTIRGAGLDVFELEPVVSPELFEMDEVVITPHVGTLTYENRAQMVTDCLSAIVDFFAGKDVATVVNKEYLK